MLRAPLSCNQTQLGNLPKPPQSKPKLSWQTSSDTNSKQITFATIPCFWQSGLMKNTGTLIIPLELCWSQQNSSHLLICLTKPGPKALGAVCCWRHYHKQLVLAKATALAPPHIFFSSHSQQGLKFRVLVMAWHTAGRVITSSAQSQLSPTTWLDTVLISLVPRSVKMEKKKILISW